MLLRTSKYLKPNSVVLETNSGLGGRASILARANKNIIIHSIESFDQDSLKREFDSMQSWAREQLFDNCKDNNVDKKIGHDLLQSIQEDFESDTSGKLAWDRITKKYSNIKLHHTSTLNDFVNWDTPLDVCLINTHQNPMFKTNLEFWSKHVKFDGYIIAHLYHETYGVDVYNGINELLNQGWKIVEKVDTMVCIQRS